MDSEREHGHFIPDDDYAHEVDGLCGCNPYLHSLPGIGTGVIHRTIRTDPVPDTLPESWNLEDT